MLNAVPSSTAEMNAFADTSVSSLANESCSRPGYFSGSYSLEGKDNDWNKMLNAVPLRSSEMNAFADTSVSSLVDESTSKPDSHEIFNKRFKFCDSEKSVGRSPSGENSLQESSIEVEIKRIAMREAMIKAATEREIAWNKRTFLKKSPSIKVKQKNEEVLSSERELNPDTEISIKLAKQAEKQTAAKMGYDPFRFHINSNSADVRATMLSSSVGPMSSRYVPSNYNRNYNHNHKHSDNRKSTTGHKAKVESPLVTHLGRRNASGEPKENLNVWLHDCDVIHVSRSLIADVDEGTDIYLSCQRCG